MQQRLNVFGIAIAAICAAFVVAAVFWGPNGFRLPTAAEIGLYDGIGTATAADCANQKKS